MNRKENKRVLAIDLARGISVVLMVLVHTLLVYGNNETRHHSVMGTVVGILGQGAPMFLISMGISYVFSRSSSLQLTVKRACIILGIGYLMNVLKFIVPITLMGGLPDSFVEAYGMTPGEPSNMVFFLLLGDILQLAGISLLLMGILTHISNNKFLPLAAALAIILLSKELSGYHTGVAVIDYFCDLLWSNTFNVYFPVFPWTAFILLGLFFGRWYEERGRDQYFLFSRMAFLGVALVGAGGALCLWNYDYHFGDFYHLGPGGTLALMGITLEILSLMHVFVKYIKPNAVFRFLYYCSKKVTVLYVTQWVLINWGMVVFGFWQHEALTVLGLMVFFLMASIGFVKGLDRWVEGKKERKMVVVD